MGHIPKGVWVAKAIAGGELYVFRQIDIKSLKEYMKNKNLKRTPAFKLSEEELKILDEFTLVLTKINSLGDKLSIYDIAYIIRAVFSEKDVRSLKEVL